MGDDGHGDHGGDHGGGNDTDTEHDMSGDHMMMKVSRTQISFGIIFAIIFLQTG